MKLKSDIQLSIDEIESLLLNTIKFGFQNVGNFTRNIHLTFLVDMRRDELWFSLSEFNCNNGKEIKGDTLILNYKQETYRFSSGGLTKLLSIKALKLLFRLHKSRGTVVSVKWGLRQPKIHAEIIANNLALIDVGCDELNKGDVVEFLNRYSDGYCQVDFYYYKYSRIKPIKLRYDIPQNFINFLN